MFQRDTGPTEPAHTHRARPHTSEREARPVTRLSQQAQALSFSTQAQLHQPRPATNGRQRGIRDGDKDRDRATAPRPRTMPSMELQSSASLPTRCSIITSTSCTDVAVPPSPIDTRGTLAALLRSSSTAASTHGATVWPPPQHRRASSDVVGRGAMSVVRRQDRRSTPDAASGGTVNHGAGEGDSSGGGGGNHHDAHTNYYRHDDGGGDVSDHPRIQFNIFAHSRAAEQREKEIEALVCASRHRAQQVRCSLSRSSCWVLLGRCQELVRFVVGLHGLHAWSLLLQTSSARGGA